MNPGNTSHSPKTQKRIEELNDRERIERERLRHGAYSPGKHPGWIRQKSDAKDKSDEENKKGTGKKTA